MAAERIELTTPAGPDWAPVVRLVLGGLGDRLHLGFNELDDLQLAVERLLAEAGAQQRSVRMTIELGDERLIVQVGPLAESGLADALDGPASAPGTLTLRTMLDTLVDAFGVEHAEDGGLSVRLEKLAHGRRAAGGS